MGSFSRLNAYAPGQQGAQTLLAPADPNEGGHVRIYRALTSYTLKCGCLVGVYETSDHRTVHLVDSVGETCRQHRVNQSLAGATSPQIPEAESAARSSLDPNGDRMTVIRFSS